METRKEIENAISHFKIKANQLAHPVNLVFDDGEIQHHGLTKREYFAGLAMQGMAMSDLKFEDIAHDAVKISDALLAELEKTEKQ
jgi:hypothetical protein